MGCDAQESFRGELQGFSIDAGLGFGGDPDVRLGSSVAIKSMPA